MFIVMVFWLGSDSPRRDFLFFVPALIFSMLTPLFTFFVCFFILFHYCCSHARVFGKKLVHEFLISYNRNE